METPKPSETRESVNFDRELAVATFDYCIDQYHKGNLTYADAIETYRQVMQDAAEQDKLNG